MKQKTKQIQTAPQIYQGPDGKYYEGTPEPAFTTSEPNMVEETVDEAYLPDESNEVLAALQRIETDLPKASGEMKPYLLDMKHELKTKLKTQQKAKPKEAAVDMGFRAWGGWFLAGFSWSLFIVYLILGVK